MKSRIAVSSCSTEVKLPRRIRFVVSSRKKRSTMFSQELLVTLEPAPDVEMLVSGVVVDDEVKVEPLWGFPVDLLQKPNPLLISMAGHAFADDASFEHIQSSEQRRCPVTLVVVCHRSASSLLDRETRLSAVQCLNL